MIQLSRLLCLVAVAIPALGAAARAAQAGAPLTLADGRVRLGGSATGTLAPEDPGFFNYTSYGQDALRLVRLELAAEARLAAWVTLVGELRSDAIEAPHARAAYVRLRPFKTRDLDLQAGRIPPVFGAYARRAYGPDDPLPGSPLGYQYLTSLRTDAVPATATELLARRGDGWRVRYSTGSAYAGPGLPLVSADRFDVGIEGRAQTGPVSVSVAVTQGTLCEPRVDDDNDGKQLSARLAWRVSPALTLGFSGARGASLSRVAEQALPAGEQRRSFRQHALGADADFALGHWIVRGEAIWSRWDMPVLEPPTLEHALDALAFSLEGRYKVAPGFHLAARYDHIGFEEIESGHGLLAWDAPVSRIEVGGGYALRRDLVLKASYQWNERDAGPLLSNGLPAIELGYWF